MNNSDNPPTYDALYTQGAQANPVPTHPMPVHPVQHPVPTQQVIGQPQTHPVLVQPQPHMFVHVPVQQQPGYSRAVIIGREMNMEPVYIVCQTCNYSVSTRTETRPALRTHLFAACMCAVGLWPCCVIPYCIPGCNDVDHFCPKCNTYIGSYTG